MSKLNDAMEAMRVLTDVAPIEVFKGDPKAAIDYAERVTATHSQRRTVDPERVKKGVLDAKAAVQWLHENGDLVKVVIELTKGIPLAELTQNIEKLRAAVQSALGREQGAAA